jgi:hypothetical protein
VTFLPAGRARALLDSTPVSLPGGSSSEGGGAAPAGSVEVILMWSMNKIIPYQFFGLSLLSGRPVAGPCLFRSKTGTIGHVPVNDFVACWSVDVGQATADDGG